MNERKRNAPKKNQVFHKQNNRLKCLSKNAVKRLFVNQSSESSPSRAVLRIFPSDTCLPDEVKVKCTLLSSCLWEVMPDYMRQLNSVAQRNNNISMGRRHHQKYKQYKQSSINRNGLNVLC